MKNRIHSSASDRIYMVLNYLFLSIVFVIVVYPLIYILSSSFSSTRAVVAGEVVFFPVEFSLKGYEAVFSTDRIWLGYRNTVFYTVFGTLFNMVLTILAAYPLSRSDFKPRRFILLVYTFTMFFGGGVIPYYLLVRSLGLINSPWAMVVLGGISTYNVILMRTFFESNISKELLEAAQIESCGDFRFLIQIALPLSKAVLAVIALFYAVGHWNEYFIAMLCINDQNLFPLQIVLRDILILNSIDTAMLANVDTRFLEAKQGLADLLKFSLIVVASIPVLMLYPFVQKYFVKGIMIGAIKG
jgi:putative aldouronate transport system permease protein